MNKRDIEVVTKLIKFTYEKKIIWKQMKNYVYGKFVDDIYIDNVFETTINGAIFSLTKYASKTVRIGMFGRIMDNCPTQFNPNVKLEIRHGDTVMYTSHTSSLWDLFNAIKRNTIDIDRILEDIINENI